MLCSLAAGTQMASPFSNDIFSPPVFTATWTEPAAWAAYIVGALIFLVGVLSLAFPEATYLEFGQVVLAAVLFASPWLIGFTAVAGMAWTAWIAGVAIVLAVGSY